MTRNAIAFLFSCALMVTTPAAADTKTWTGAVDHRWSVGGNWVDGVAPASGDSLVFPSGAANLIMGNDLAGLSLQTITITGSGYTFNGNAIGLAGGKSSPSCCVNTIWNLPTTLTAAQTFLDNGTVEYTNVIDLNGHALTLRPSTTTFSGSIVGSGSVEVTGGGLHFTGTSTFTGVFNVSGRLNVAGTISTPLVITGGGRLSGNGTVGAVDVRNGILSPGNDPGAGCCGDPGVVGILTTGPLQMEGGRMRFEALSTTSGSGHDQIVAKGAVTLLGRGPHLQLVALAAPPTPGQSFTLIDNQSSTSISGRFSAVTSEGGGVPFQVRITHVSDVVATALAPTTVTATSSKNPAVSGEQVTWTAHVTSAHGTPTGFVSFDGIPVLFIPAQHFGSATVVDGKASITAIAGRVSGPFTAPVSIVRFTGTGPFADSSAQFSQGIIRVPTEVRVILSAATIVLGEAVTARVQLTGRAAANMHFAQGTLLIDGQPFATGSFSNEFVVKLPPLGVGTHEITATYPGDRDRLPSTSNIAVLTVTSNVTIPTLGFTALVLLAISLAVIGSRFLLR